MRSMTSLVAVSVFGLGFLGSDVFADCFSSDPVFVQADRRDGSLLTKRPADAGPQMVSDGGPLLPGASLVAEAATTGSSGKPAAAWLFCGSSILLAVLLLVRGNARGSECRTGRPQGS